MPSRSMAPAGQAERRRQWALGSNGLRPDSPKWGQGDSEEARASGNGMREAANTSVYRRLGGSELELAAGLSLDATQRQSLGLMADLRSLYATDAPGRECNRPCEVIAEPAALLHIAQAEEARLVRILERGDLVAKAISEPEIVYREPQRLRNGHYSQLLAVPDPNDPLHYLVLVVSLANPPGDPRSEFHLLTTMYPARRQYFFRTLPDRHLELKQRWMFTARQRAGT